MVLGYLLDEIDGAGGLPFNSGLFRACPIYYATELAREMLNVKCS